VCTLPKMEQYGGGPRLSALALLPHLLSNPPFLPASVCSAALNRRHQLLDTSPEEVEEYLVTDVYPSENRVAGRAVELLRSLAAQVELLGDNDSLEGVIGEIQYKCMEKGEVIVGVQLGADQLTLVLKLEGDCEEESSFKYDNLLPANTVEGPWSSSIDEAVKAQQTASALFRTSMTADECGGDEGHFPSEYITDADDFWAGYQSDEEREALNKKGKSMAAAEAKEGQLEDRIDSKEKEQPRCINSDKRTTASDSEECSKGFHSQNDAVKLIIKGAWRLMQASATSDRNDTLSEDDFLRLAREAIQECKSPGDFVK
jgi:hypothetical protein